MNHNYLLADALMWQMMTIWIWYLLRKERENVDAYRDTICDLRQTIRLLQGEPDDDTNA